MVVCEKLMTITFDPISGQLKIIFIFMKVFGTPSRAGTLKIQSAKISKSAAEQTDLRTT